MSTFHRQGRRGKGGHYSLVNNVRGDIIHGGTIFTPTTSHGCYGAVVVAMYMVVA